MRTAGDWIAFAAVGLTILAGAGIMGGRLAALETKVDAADKKLDGLVAAVDAIAPRTVRVPAAVAPSVVKAGMGAP